MLHLSWPEVQRVQTLIARQQIAPFSYPEVGATRGEFPAGYSVLRSRVELGHGAENYARAQQAVRNWKMFAIPNVSLYSPGAPIAPGTVIAVGVKHFGFWSLNFCRIVYTINEDMPILRYGFAYGTLREHFESGEERFVVEWDRKSDVVSYEIVSFSRPGKILTWLALPLARRLQRRFVKESSAAMRRAVSEGINT
jgi:uncharacterized protein (UPF0548 family)